MSRRRVVVTERFHDISPAFVAGEQVDPEATINIVPVDSVVSDSGPRPDRSQATDIAFWFVPEIRVLSYNVRGLRDDVAALTRVVRHCRPDVLVVQEAPSVLRWRSRCAAFARECELLYTAGGRTGGGNLLLVAPRIDVHDVRESRIWQPWRDPIRGVVSARLGLDEGRFGVVGFHLGLNPRRRAAEVRKVVAAGRSFGDEPTLIAGDFNETPEAAGWAAFGEAGFTDPLDGADRPPTFPVGTPKARIDAILLTKHFEVKEYGVPDAPSIRADLLRATDHLPVLAVVEVP
ncbi:endonuclease/exonuclease/phosphatase family protein [Flindersiella endophytica]